MSGSTEIVSDRLDWRGGRERWPLEDVRVRD